MTPTTDLLNDRGLMGEGCIDLPGIRTMVERNGFKGMIEVEVFSKNRWWNRHPNEFLKSNQRILLKLHLIMKEHKLGIIMNGVTGRMGTNQHLIRSICAIRDQGGVQISPNEKITVDPILTGRNEDKLKALAEKNGVFRWTTNLTKH